MMTAETHVYPTPRCFVCGQSGSVELPADGVAAYNAGALIQVAFPNLDKGLREQIISGTHPACWDAMIAGDE